MRTQRRFRDRVTIALESHVARLQRTVASIDHHERPEYLDRLAVLRNQSSYSHMYMSLFTTCGWVLRLGSQSRCHVGPPALALLSHCAAHGAHSTWRPGVEREAEEKAPLRTGSPPSLRHRDHRAPGKEVRVTRIGRAWCASAVPAWSAGSGDRRGAPRQRALVALAG